LPFYRLKIDRSFILDFKNDDTKNTLFGAIISIGIGFDLPLVAEGIENDAILKTLRQMGQLKGQGYHYGRPEPAADVLKRLEPLGLLAPDASLDDRAMLALAELAPAEPTKKTG